MLVKKMLMRLLTALLCLMLAVASAMAANTTVLPEMEEYHEILNMVTVGDTVYLLDYSDIEARLLRWTADMAQAETVAAGLLYADRFNTVEQAQENIASLADGSHADAEHALSRIFTDGEKLYGMNDLNRLVFTIDVGANGLTYTDVATLPRVGERTYVSPTSVVCMGDWVLWCEVDTANRYRDSRMLVFNLARGTVKQAVLPGLQGVSAYQDGVALVRCNEDGVDVLYTYDPVTDVTECIGSLDVSLGSKPTVYSDALDVLVYLQQTRIMGWSAETGTEQIGYIPANNVKALTVAGERLLYREGTAMVYACDVRRGFTTENSLTQMNSLYTGRLKQFATTHPEVQVYFEQSSSTQDAMEAMTGETNVPDMLLADATYDLDALIEADALLDLSQYEEIQAYIDALYPAYRDHVTRDGAIYGVPTQASSQDGWFINKEVMNAMGLTAEDIPTNLVDLIAFADKWDREYLEKYPNFTLLNEVGSYRLAFLEQILADWSAYCQAQGKTLNYDDPIFRQLLSALDAANFDALDASLQQTDPEVSEYKQALIWRGCRLVGNWSTYMEACSDRIFIPMTLTADTAYTVAVTSCTFWTVSAKTQNAQAAADYLIELIEMLGEKAGHTLRADCTEPVFNEYAEDILASAEERLTLLEASLVNSVNPETVEKKIEEQKAYMAGDMLREVYLIVPSAAENYAKVIAPAAVVYTPDAVDETNRSAEIAVCIAQYCGGYDLEPLDAEGFIAQMNTLVAN